MLIAFLVNCYWLVWCVSATGPIVKTDYGSIEGLEVKARDDSKANIYLGIRYAKAPADVHSRFEKPQLIKPWGPNVHQATAFGPACFPFHENDLLNISYSEDCLFLNIFTPAKLTKKVPVFVFIHGGGFEVGSAIQYGYRNIIDNFVTTGIIAITIQYRLGPLGFFSLGNSDAPGNMGLWDLTVALEFLNKILPEFGGDVENITVSGHSAGACAVSALTFSPHSEIYFQRAVEFSGSIFSEFALSERVTKVSLKLAEHLGCIKSGEQIDTKKILNCMKQLDAITVIRGVKKMGPAKSHPNFIQYHPRLDGHFFPYELDQLAKSAAKKAVLSGIMTMESGVFIEHPLSKNRPIFESIELSDDQKAQYSENDLLSFITKSVATKSEYGEKSALFVKSLEEFYIKRNKPVSPNNEFYVARYIELLSDLQFVIPGIQELNVRRLNGWPSYFYLIDYIPTLDRKQKRLAYGAWHAAELRFLFDIAYAPVDSFSDEDRKFQKHFVDSIVQFIKTGNPSTETLTWKPVSSCSPYIHAEFTSEVKMVKDFEPEKRKRWLDDIPRIVGSRILRQTRLPGAAVYAAHIEL